MQPCSSRQVSAVPFEVRIRPRSQRNRETCCRMPYLFMCMWDRVYDVFHHIIILILIINIYIYIYIFIYNIYIYICVCICICWHTWLKSIVSGCVNVCMFPCFHFFNVHLRNMYHDQISLRTVIAFKAAEPNCSTSEENFLSGVLSTAIHGPLGQGCHRPVPTEGKKKWPLAGKVTHRIGWYKMGLLDRIGWEALGFIGTFANPSGRWFGFWHMWPNDINRPQDNHKWAGFQPFPSGGFMALGTTFMSLSRRDLTMKIVRQQGQLRLFI